MKAFLLIIFFLVHLYCSAQQTDFEDLKQSLKQPENVKSLRLNYWNSNEKLRIDDLAKLKNINKLFLRTQDIDFNYSLFFETIAKLSLLDSLELDNCSLRIIPDEIGKMTSLKYLKITHCHLTKISDEIKQLKSLTCFDLNSNSISILPDVFDSLINLKTLDLHHNNLNRLPQSICSLNNLEEIELYQNKLISLPEQIGQLRHLKSISLSDNELTSLPASCDQLQLEQIYIGKNPFVRFPYQIFDISTLKKISLYDINIDSLPRSISKLKNLEAVFLNLGHEFNWRDAFIKMSHNENLHHLSLWGYRMEQLPEEIGLLKNLKKITIRGFGNTSKAVEYLSGMNNLTELILPFYDEISLPASIGTLSNLKVLKMEYCHIQTLPSSIAQLTSLEELYITKYPSEALIIPDEIGNLVNLKVIDFTRCEIKKMPVSIRNLTQLKTIELFGNNFVTIPDEFAEFKLLETLDLGGNQITSIPIWISQMQYLKELYLWENKIESVPSDVWKIKSLETLLLNDNNIVAFEIPDLPANQLRELSLSDNINLKVLPDFICQLSNLEYLGLECTQIEQVPVCVKQQMNLQRIILSENFIANKRSLNNACGGIINFKGTCEQLTRLSVNFHNYYGEITTDIKAKNDSITLYYHYRYNEPDKFDEEYDENVFFVLHKAEVKPGSKFILPDSLVKVLVMHLSIWDMLLPEWKFKYENLQGEISFIAIKKDKIKTYIHLYCDGYDDTKRILIDHKTIVFKKKK